MSGVYIKGMEMPTTCAKCPLGHINAKRYAIECYAEYPTKLFDYNLARHSINPFCHLVPVPPHGRLIDADALHYSRVQIVHPGGIVGGYNAVVMSAEIKSAPTIIPASEEGE